MCADEFSAGGAAEPGASVSLFFIYLRGIKGKIGD